LGSSNGTQINGVCITDAELKDGAEIRFGYVTGVFQDATASIDQARKLQVPGERDRPAQIRLSETQSILGPRARNEELTIATMRVRNEDRSPVGIHGSDAAPTPTGFAEIVSDDFPLLLHARWILPVLISTQQ
jgi:pSer/pThr/pTyr-binding forkhead associated (FHA) protein